MIDDKIKKDLKSHLPQTDVILNLALEPRKLPFHSWILQAPLNPFLVEHFLSERMLAIEAASDGFSATIITVATILNFQKFQENRR